MEKEQKLKDIKDKWRASFIKNVKREKNMDISNEEAEILEKAFEDSFNECKKSILELFESK